MEVKCSFTFMSGKKWQRKLAALSEAYSSLTDRRKFSKFGHGSRDNCWLQTYLTDYDDQPSQLNNMFTARLAIVVVLQTSQCNSYITENIACSQLSFDLLYVE